MQTNVTTSTPEYADLIGFARNIAKRFARRLPANVDVDELVSAGYLGLADAIKKHDRLPTEDFAALARRRIRGAIQDELRRQDVLPRSERRKVRAMAAVENRLAQALLRSPNEAEVAEALGVSPSSCSQLRVGASVRRADVSIDEDASAEPASRPSMAPDVVACKRIDLARVNAALDVLTEREQLVFQRIYVDGQSSRDVSVELALTEARISQVHAGIIAKLRRQLSAGIDERSTQAAS